MPSVAVSPAVFSIRRCYFSYSCMWQTLLFSSWLFYLAPVYEAASLTSARHCCSLLVANAAALPNAPVSFFCYRFLFFPELGAAFSLHYYASNLSFHHVPTICSSLCPSPAQHSFCRSSTALSRSLLEPCANVLPRTWRSRSSQSPTRPFFL